MKRKFYFVLLPVILCLALALFGCGGNTVNQHSVPERTDVSEASPAKEDSSLDSNFENADKPVEIEKTQPLQEEETSAHQSAGDGSEESGFPRVSENELPIDIIN